MFSITASTPAGSRRRRESDMAATRLSLHVGEVIPLAPLGYLTEAKVLSQTWSPALGEIVRLREERHGQPSCVLVLYGELLNRLLRA